MNTIIEKIRAEVERLYDEANNYDDSRHYLGEVLSFLSDLEKECEEKPTTAEGLDVTDFCKPIDPGIAQCVADHLWEMLGEDEKPSDGLEEEIERYLHSLGVGYGGWVDGMEDDDLRGIARHFYELGRQSKPKVSDGLEEEAESCWRIVFPDGGIETTKMALTHDEFIMCARHFAQWQKQHDAELIEIAYNDGITIGMTKQKEQMMKEAVEGKIAERRQGKLYARCQVPKTIKVEFCDKVRVIIVKED